MGQAHWNNNIFNSFLRSKVWKTDARRAFINILNRKDLLGTRRFLEMVKFYAPNCQKCFVFIAISSDHRKAQTHPLVHSRHCCWWKNELHENSWWEFFKFQFIRFEINNGRRMKTELTTIYQFTRAFVGDLATVNRTCWEIHWIRGANNARKRSAHAMYSFQ